METYFAPADRTIQEKIINDYSDLKSFPYLNDLFNALPYVATILNPNRQFVFSNDRLLKQFGMSSIHDLLGKRPGEILQCIHAKEMPGGCGTSESCEICEAVNTILKSQKSKKKIVSQCRIRSQLNNEPVCFDIEIMASPFFWKDNHFTLFTIRDISDEKRKQTLERIFFHDVINTAGTLQGLVDLLKQTDNPAKIKQFITLLDEVSRNLTEEILAQKSLIAAENGELTLNITEFATRKFLNSLIRSFKTHELGLNKVIVLKKDMDNVVIKTDIVLLKRILGHMIKNALEASKEDEIITIGCEQSDTIILFWVHNPVFIPRKIQLQLFQRSFSTKGKGRGLGTYSMKLLGEKYLQGKVRYASSESDGTTFYLEIPKILNVIE